ncbi:hypothetical protein EVAR_46333_1 [Eumeta japonica]|uniref:Uncharacterized protein n=1 Tax=Eumeta variegata TaxID=151549 RepID=A0A4C1WY53_EUMVA|nr:hypothetical protein EVAR_46333_1 [Eumeta japonica]
MSPLGCQYVMRTYWIDASTPAVAAWIGNEVDTRRPHGERGEHPRLYKQGHPKGAPSSSAAADGEATRRGSSPPQGVKLSSTTTTAFHSEPYQVEEQSSFTLVDFEPDRKSVVVGVLKKEDLSVAAFGLP